MIYFKMTLGFDPRFPPGFTRLVRFVSKRASLDVAGSYFSAMADADKLASDVNEMTLKNHVDTVQDNSPDDFSGKWGFQLPDLYKIVLKFYKGTCEIRLARDARVHRQSSQGISSVSFEIR
jgi:hypothetical protein